MLFSFYRVNIKPVPYSELSMPKKEPVPIVNQTTSSATALQQITNSVFGAGDVESDLSGNVLMSKNATNFPGSNSGFKKAIRSGDSQSFQDTAHSKSSKSKMIGLSNLRSATQISREFNTSSMTALISEETIALSRS
jgi:hypothetical protein